MRNQFIAYLKSSASISGSLTELLVKEANEVVDFSMTLNATGKAYILRCRCAPAKEISVPLNASNSIVWQSLLKHIQTHATIKAAVKNPTELKAASTDSTPLAPASVQFSPTDNKVCCARSPLH